MSLAVSSSQPVTSALVDSSNRFPIHRSLTAFVTSGLAGVIRVLMLLHSRRYLVADVRVQVREGVLESRVSCTVLLTPSQNDLLLERLRRIPVVVSADNC